MLNPEAGRIPDYELDPRVDTYTASVQWFEMRDDGYSYKIGEDEKVHAGKAYKAAVHVRTAEGHKFERITSTGINTHTAICSVCGEAEDQDCIYVPEYIEGPSEYSKYNATVFICQCGAFSHLAVRPGDCDHELSDPIGIEGGDSHYRICACESVVEKEECTIVASYVKGPSDYAERDVIVYRCIDCGIFNMTPIEGELPTKDEAKDEETGISVSVGEGSAALPEDVTFSADEIDESKISDGEMKKISEANGGKAEYVAGYDMCFSYGEYGYSIFESVVVFIPIEDYEPDYKYVACYLNDSYEYVISTVCVSYDDTESVSFVADHFSIYIIVRVEENEIPEHQHVFVDGECECGEKDPTYAPEHQHKFVDGECECGEKDPDYTPTPDEPTEKDHSKCEASGWKRFWNAIGNFFRKLFGMKKKCVCGDKYE